MTSAKTNRRISAVLGATATLWLATTLSTQPAAAETTYREGERVLVTGVVTDASGEPVSGLQVTLQASHQRLRWKSLSREETDPRRLDTFTDDSGEYTLEWTWYDYYNQFDLFVGRKGASGDFEVLERVDLTNRMERGSPVISTVALGRNVDLGETHRGSEAATDVQPTVRPATARQPATPRKVASNSAGRFASGLSSDDELRIYDRHGQPDTVKRFRYPTYRETTWWYFREGKAYTFRDGQLEREFAFDPVIPF